MQAESRLARSRQARELQEVCSRTKVKARSFLKTDTLSVTQAEISATCQNRPAGRNVRLCLAQLKTKPSAATEGLV